MYQPANAPQSVGGVLDDGFGLFRASLKSVIGLFFLAALVGQIPNLMISSGDAVPSLTPMLVVSLLIAMLVSAVLYGAAFVRMNGVARQRPVPIGGALRTSLRRLPALLGYGLLYGIIVLVGTLLLVVPGLLFGVSLAFGAYLVLLDGKGPLDSLRLSHRLVWGHWWRTMIILSVGGIILMVAYLLVIFVAGFLIAWSAPERALAQAQLLQFVLLPVLMAVIGPLFYALMMATFYDLKLRRSGADLEQRLGAPAAA